MKIFRVVVAHDMTNRNIKDAILNDNPWFKEEDVTVYQD